MHTTEPTGVRCHSRAIVVFILCTESTCETVVATHTAFFLFVFHSGHVDFDTHDCHGWRIHTLLPRVGFFLLVADKHVATRSLSRLRLRWWFGESLLLLNKILLSFLFDGLLLSGYALSLLLLPLGLLSCLFLL